MKVANLACKQGVSEPSIYRWQAKYGGMTAVHTKRLRQLEEENARLKRIVAELSLDKQMLNDVLSKKWLGRPRASVWSAIFGGTTVSANAGPAGYCSCTAPWLDMRVSPGLMTRPLKNASMSWPNNTPVMTICCFTVH